MASAAQLRKQKEKKDRIKNLRRLQKLAHSRLSRHEEQQAVETCKHLHRCLLLLRGEIKDFLLSWGLAPRRDEDTSTMLRTLIDYNKRIPNFISLTSNRIEIDTKTILTAVYARNKICHGNLPAVLREFQSFLLAWIEVAIMIGTHSLATRFRQTLNLLNDPSQSGKKAFTVPPYIIFQSLASERTRKWTKNQEAAAISHNHHLFDIVVEELGPSLNLFIKENRLRDDWSSNMDVYADRNLLLDNCCPETFVVPHGTTDEEELRDRLEKTMDGRHAICHDEHRNVTDNWPTYLTDFVFLLTAIDCPGAATRVQAKLDLLLTERDKAYKTPLPTSQFAFRRRSHSVAKAPMTGKPPQGGQWIRRNSMWLKRSPPSVIGAACRKALKRMSKLVIR